MTTNSLALANSKISQSRWWFSGWLLVFTLLLAIGEIAMRNPALTSRLPAPEPTFWHAENVQAKLDYLRHLQAQKQVDVLFLGNSTVLAGMNPHIFDQQRGVGEEAPVAAFNGALEGLPAAGSYTFAQLYLHASGLPKSYPQTIIYGLTPQDVNPNSPSGQQITEKIGRAPMVIAQTKTDPLAWVVGWLLEHSQLYRYRTVLHQYLISGGSMPKPIEIYFDARGWVSDGERLADVPATERARFYNRDGVINYTATGEQLAALNELIQLCASRGIQLILVNMPLTDNYYGNFASPADYPAYIQAVSALAATQNVPFWDMEKLPPAENFADSHFSDFNHLNRFGAEKLGRLLAQRYQAFNPIDR